MNSMRRKDLNQFTQNCSKPDIAQRLLITFWVLLLFILISSKFMYGITNNLGLNTFEDNSPTFTGYIVHAAVFGLLVFISTYLSIPSV
jgi:preprotein translocase subunit SecY